MEHLSHTHTDNSHELLSAYIDNAVDAGERRRAEQLIAACAACAQEAQELRMFRELLASLPNVQPRRSFTLDPATVVPQRRLLFPTLRWSSLVAALLFVVVLGADVLGNRSMEAQSSLPRAVPAAESAAKAYPPQFDSSTSGGGPADAMMAQGSPAASAAPQGNAESATMPFGAEMQPTTVAAAPAASAAPRVAVPESLALASPPVEAAASPPSALPSMGDTVQAPATLAEPAGGVVAQPQMGFRADEPAGADTLELDQTQTARGSWWSSYGLRIAEIALGLIALVLGGAALWTWRQQL